MAALGFRLNLNSATLMAGFAALRAIHHELATIGRVSVDGVGGLFDQLNTLLGLPAVESQRQRYGVDPA